MMEEASTPKLGYMLSLGPSSQIKINSLPTDKNPPMMNVSKQFEHNSSSRINI